MLRWVPIGENERERIRHDSWVSAERYWGDGNIRNKDLKTCLACFFQPTYSEPTKHLMRVGLRSLEALGMGKKNRKD